MAREDAHSPNRTLEDWTDAELVDQFRYLEAETEEVPGNERDNAPMERLRQELRRRGLESVVDEVDADAASPGRETADPERRTTG